MASVCFYFQVHQPFRIKKYRIFDVGNDPHYFNDKSDNDTNNEKIFHRVANKSYLPTNKLMLHLLKKHPEFKITFSFTGVFLDQLEMYSPETLKSFQDLVATGRVEILSETYYHSLAFIYSKNEFTRQVKKHRKKIKELFGVTPTVFRNTELIYNNEVAKEAEKIGFKGIIAEGAEKILGWKSPNFLYTPEGTDNIKVLLKNYRLSDDIAFRFSDKSWSDYPLTAQKLSKWISETKEEGSLINLFMDYETFGEHQWEDTGIFHMLESLPAEILKYSHNKFVTPSEAIDNYPAVSKIDIPDYVSWADTERDLSAWLDNEIQQEAVQKVYALEPLVYESNDKDIMEDWRRLQTSDHFYYMSTKWMNDGTVHTYFSPYESPYDAFMTYMNALKDLKIRITKKIEIYKGKTPVSISKISI